MQALFTIGWFLWFVVSLYMTFHTIGWSGLVQMFPEGRRWWMLPAQLAALAAFTASVYFNPWSYHGL